MRKTLKTFTYFEPKTEGHSAIWATWLLERLLRHEAGMPVRLAAGAALIERLPAALRDDPALSIDPLPDGEMRALMEGSLVARGLAQWGKARRLLSERPGICFIPAFDHALLGACVDRRPVDGIITGIIFRPPNHFGLTPSLKGRVDTARRRAMYFASRRRATPFLFTLDETAARDRMTAGRLLFSPDPAPDLSLLAVPGRKPRDDGRRGLLIFGALSRRKGVVTLLRAIRHIAPERQRGLALRMVGRIAGEDRAEIEAALSECRSANPDMAIELVDRFVTDAELAQEVVNCDVVLAPYQNHVGSSGVLFWAAAAGKPVIAQETGLMGYQARLHRLGTTTDTTDPQALARAIEGEPAISREDAGAFVAEHTADNFARSIFDRLLA